MHTETFTCDNCGYSYPCAERVAMDGQELCRNCSEEETYLCTSCGERIWQDDNAGDEDVPLCQSCYDRHYTNCIRCNALIHVDDACYSEDDPAEEEPLCHDCCHHPYAPKVIQDYYYKPEPVFYGEGPRYFGVELEMDNGGEISSRARELLELANREHSLAYAKHDGSLDDGFELVTHPMSLDWHREQMPWAAVLERAVKRGYQSHMARTCGLHIHVSRAALGDTEAAQDAVIARILYFFERHWDELLKFSRRTETQLKRWAARYGYKEQPMEILDRAKQGYGGGRYSSVNLQNRDTIEFRIFRGTLKYNTVIATLQLVNRVCDVAIALSDEELKALPWTTFVSAVTEPELIQYLKERRLYVNEPVEVGVEN